MQKMILLLTKIFLGLGLLIIGILSKLLPPKKINYLYGYRTKRAMRSDESWKVANSLAFNLFIFIGLVSIIAGILSFLYFPETRITEISTVAMLLCIFPVIEYHLIASFDKDGKRK